MPMGILLIKQNIHHIISFSNGSFYTCGIQQIPIMCLGRMKSYFNFSHYQIIQ